MDWAKLVFALFVGVAEFAKALNEDVDADAEGKKALQYVAENDAARKAAQDNEDGVFSSTTDGD